MTDLKMVLVYKAEDLHPPILQHRTTKSQLTITSDDANTAGTPQ